MGSIIKMGYHAKVYRQWKEVHEVHKMNMVDLVKAKFDIPPGSQLWLLQSFAKNLRNYRADLKKKYYNPMHTARQKRKTRPHDFLKRSWQKLIKYWDSEDAQKVSERSERNKDNRKFKIMTQSTDKKSFARCVEELKDELGREPTRVERFVKCYLKKDRTPSNDSSADAMANMNAEIAQLPDGENDKVGPDDVFAKVMGKDKDGLA